MQDFKRAIIWHERYLENGSIYSLSIYKEYPYIKNLEIKLKKCTERFEKCEIQKWEKESGLNYDNMN